MTKDIETLIADLDSVNWIQAATAIYNIVKEEVHGNFIESERQKHEPERQESLRLARIKWVAAAREDIENLDKYLNSYTAEIEKINMIVQDNLNYDLLNQIRINAQMLSKKCPSMIAAIKYIDADKGKQEASIRLQAIIGSVVGGSTIQSGKANAGQAGEMMVSAMFEVMGLEKGIDYGAQFKSEIHANTDFTLPYAEKNRPQDVEVFMAVQFSSNDRLRMVSGELKTGAKAYAIIGNGMEASTKPLTALPTKTLKGMVERGHRMVCYKEELHKTITELKKKSNRQKANGGPYANAKSAKDRLDYFKDYAMTFAEFAKKYRPS